MVLVDNRLKQPYLTCMIHYMTEEGCPPNSAKATTPVILYLKVT